MIKVGSGGFVRLVEVMGSDSTIVQSARVSYGQDIRTYDDIDLDELLKIQEKVGTTDKEVVWEEFVRVRSMNDRKLIRYLMRHRHTTPFEMVEVRLLVRVPMDCWRQWIRHRTANVNEYSTRYKPAIDEKATTKEWRSQATNNKQGSDGLIDELPEGWVHRRLGDSGWVFVTPKGRYIPSSQDETFSQYLTRREAELHKISDEIYQERLDSGVAKEQARKDLPLSTYTESYWKCDLHNLFHFLSLRMDSHAQLEIRQFANAIAQLIAPEFPDAWEAFEDYRLNGQFLTGPVTELIEWLFQKVDAFGSSLELVDQGIQELSLKDLEAGRERQDALRSIDRLLGTNFTGEV